METVLAERVALQLWRLYRVARLEVTGLPDTPKLRNELAG
jgi:hypothetical protein